MKTNQRQGKPLTSGVGEIKGQNKESVCIFEDMTIFGAVGGVQNMGQMTGLYCLPSPLFMSTSRRQRLRHLPQGLSVCPMPNT